MAIVQCRVCGKKISDRAPTCPHCNAGRKADPAAPPSSDDAKDTASSHEELTTNAPTVLPAPQIPMENIKKCPFCAETIKAGAIVCRYCNQVLSASIPATINTAPVTQSRTSIPASQKTSNTSNLGVGCLVLIGLSMLIGMCSEESGNQMSSSVSHDSGNYRIVSDNNYGCVNKEYDEKLMQYIIQKDMAAFSRALSACVLSGGCTMFKKGEEVFLVESTFTGRVKVRRKGDTKEYWTVREAMN